MLLYLCIKSDKGDTFITVLFVTFLFNSLTYLFLFHFFVVHLLDSVYIDKYIFHISQRYKTDLLIIQKRNLIPRSE